jgi:PAS domain S-box-containing protein
MNVRNPQDSNFLQAKIDRLQQELKDVTEAKAELELLLETITEHSTNLENEILQKNKNLLNYIAQVNKVTAAAAAVEKNCFDPRSLEDVSTRSDELGRLARIFTQAMQTIKLREQQLQREKSFSDMLIISVPGIFFLCDRQGFLVRWNARFQKVLNYSSETIESLSLLDLVVPEDRTMIAQHLDLIIQEGESITETQLLAKTGQKIPYYLTGRRIIIENESYLLGMGLDIRARKEAEKALERANQELEQKVAERTASLMESQRTLVTLMSNLPGMAYRRSLQNQKWNMIFVSEGCHCLTGYVPEDLINNQIIEYSQLIHPEDQNRVWVEVQKALAEKRPFQVTYRLFSQQGTEKWAWEQGQGIFNSEGKIEFIEGFITDISDWIRAEKALEQSNRELREALQQLEITQVELQKAKEDAESANYAKSEFLANMSHELRTPLNSIIGFAQILNRDTSFKSEQQKRLSIINRSGEHLLHLINNILEMSKIEAGQINLNETSFNLRTLLQTIQEMFYLKVQNKGIEFRLELDSNLPPYLSSDEAKLRQILINLIGNAIKFTEKGEIVLRAKVKGDEINHQSQLQLEVQDTGPGIAPEELDKLFIPFEQTSTGRKIKQGTGLGLSITSKFIKLMGGNITVKSSVGVGTCFECSIPIRIASNDTFVVKKTLGKVIGLKSKQPKYRILVVDDEADNRLLLLDLLIPIGFSVQQAQNGQQAISIWQKWHPHLIWMDLRMPEMDGYQATKQIRNQESKLDQQASPTKIIALTASILKGERQVTLASGFDDFVIKPFPEETIWEKIRQHLGVKFIYQNLAEAYGKDWENNQVKATDLSGDLNNMPSEWLNQLHQASSQLKGKKVGELIKAIPPEKAALAAELQTLADNYRFNEIMSLIAQKATPID